ncbi:hypothetical protein ABW20_dc0102939 [Dactylellina cionopaga]|nr:hypothetical protein ABW20_dc0102939 [Dactylellina cionopaga]
MSSFLVGSYIRGPHEYPIPHLRESLVKAIQQKDYSQRRYILLLVSPGHTGLITDESIVNGIAEEAIDTAGFRIKRMCIVGAVVDGLSQMGDSGNLVKTEGWSAFVSDRQFAVHPHSGSVFQDLGKKAGKEESEPVAKEEEEAVAPQVRDADAEKGELQLVFYDRKGESENQAYTRIKLKLANTIFQTGKPTTAKKYIPWLTPEMKYTQGVVENLENLTVEFNDNCAFESRIHRPLEKLTEPRKIVSGNGNIIKELSIEDGEASRTIRASEELEAAVAKWMEEHPVYDPETLEKHPIEIFAHIKEANSLRDIDNKIDTKDNRVVRVLSGGGGWGSNAGILALDPEGMEGFKIPGEQLLEEVDEATGAIETTETGEAIEATEAGEVIEATEAGEATGADAITKSEASVQFYISVPAPPGEPRSDSGQQSLGHFQFRMVSKDQDAVPALTAANVNPSEDASFPEVSSEEALPDETAKEEILSDGIENDTPTEEPKKRVSAASQEPIIADFTNSDLVHGKCELVVEGGIWINDQRTDIPGSTLTIGLVDEHKPSFAAKREVGRTGLLDKLQKGASESSEKPYRKSWEKNGRNEFARPKTERRWENPRAGSPYKKPWENKDGGESTSRFKKPWEDREKREYTPRDRKPWDNKDGDSASRYKKPWENKEGGDFIPRPKKPWDNKEFGESTSPKYTKPWEDKEGRGYTPREKKPWENRERGEYTPRERKPWENRENKEYTPRDKKPWEDREKKEYTPRDKRPWENRGGQSRDSTQGYKKPWENREGGDSTSRYRKPREDDSDAKAKFVPREGDGERKPFEKKKFGSSADGDLRYRPQREDGERPAGSGPRRPRPSGNDE